MPEDSELTGAFVLAVKQFRNANGRTDFRLLTIAQNIQTEIVLMQIRSWLRNQHNKYYKNFDQSFGEAM